MNWKNLTVTGVVLAMSVMTASALSISYSVDRDFEYSATSDPLDPNAALLITGTWDLSEGVGSMSLAGLVNWEVTLGTVIVPLGGDVNLYVLGFEGRHLTGGLSDSVSVSIGMPDIASSSVASLYSDAYHGAEVDYWVLSSQINPLGTYNFEIRAAHEGVMTGVPDVGSTSALLGFALAGLVLLRRKSC
jgi:hypothetical protein